MTTEEAIEILSDVGDINRCCAEDAEALDMAIKALEQQLSEDEEVIKVSKGAVKARQGRYVIYDVEWLKKNFYATEEKMYGQPKEPCEDCISREEALKVMCDKCPMYNCVTGCSSYRHIEKLPSVMPKYTNEEIDRAQAIEQAYIDKMVELVAEEAKRPKGKWEYVQYDYNPNIGNWHCSECRFMFVMSGVPEYKYCPNCGARMAESEDEK